MNPPVRLKLWLALFALVPGSNWAATTQAPFDSVLPAADSHTGGAVLLVPGDEGPTRDVAPLAKWLGSRGIAAFAMRPRAAGVDKAAAITDTARALRYLRAHAAEFKVSPKRVALLGYASGAEIAADVGYTRVFEAKPEAADPLDQQSGRPDLLALIWGATSTPPVAGPKHPTTFIVGSTHTSDNLGSTIDLWTQLRALRSPVDAHFFARADLKTVLAQDNESVGSWSEIFYNWVRFSGLLTDEPRVPLKGMVYLDGHPLPHGYVILTPVDFVGVGPVIARVFNSTASAPIGEFIVPAGQGPIAGRYKVDVRQNMNRWLSNSFSGDLVGGRGPITPEKAYFGHHRELGPSMDDQKSFTKVRPGDRQDYVIEIKPGADANTAMKIEVFSK